MYNIGRLLSGISSVADKITIKKKDLDLFYMLYLLKVISLDLFAVMHKSCARFFK